MQIILFSQNKHKIKEIKYIFQDILNLKINSYIDFMPDFNVVENGKSFNENAILKLKALIKNSPKSLMKDSIFMSEDSGICVEALNLYPGIYSKRFANINDINDENSILKTKDSSDEENLEKLINELNKNNLESSLAYFVSCVAVFKNNQFLSAHGLLYGKIINKKSGRNGFGYDPIFVPEGYDETLSNLDENIKNKISHRYKALELMKILLK